MIRDVNLIFLLYGVEQSYGLDREGRERNGTDVKYIKNNSSGHFDLS